MFEKLEEQRNILVTGCQRSGTRLVAKAIAEATGFEYVDETVFQPLALDGSINETKLRWWNTYFRHCVFHAPQISHKCNLFKDLFVVWVTRDPVEVRASMNRINWKYEACELANYGLPTGDIIEVKNKAWEKQKLTIPNRFLEVDYAEMKSHPMFSTERKDFKWWQTE